MESDDGVREGQAPRARDRPAPMKGPDPHGTDGRGNPESGTPRAPWHPGWLLWLAFFEYAAVTAWVVQGIVVPFLLPAADIRGNLLFDLDSWSFHVIAAHQAKQINELGWSAWTLQPRGQVLAGIVSVIYALTLPAPWILIPINAALHATAALLLLLIVESFVRDRPVALAATLPFLLYPSAMSWFTQLHKDGWFIMGVLLFIYGWLGLVRQDTWTRGLRPPLRSSAWVGLGSASIWVMREHGAVLSQALGLLLAAVVTLVFVTRGITARLAWRRAVTASITVWLVAGGITVLAAQKLPETASMAPPSVPKGPGALLAPGQPVQPPQEPLLRWQSSPWLPSVIDRPLRDLAAARARYLFRYPEARTNMDVHVAFERASDVVAYLPRAAVIALFAPFPEQWLGQGSTETGTVMRRVTAVEMIGLYLALALLPIAIWRWRRRIELHLIVGYCLVMMLVYGAAVPNVGALYRFRYGFIMTLAALGIAAGVSAWRGVQPTDESGRPGAERQAARPGGDVPDRPTAATESGG